MQRQQQAMLNDLHNLRHEANKVNNERTSAQADYIQLKNNITRSAESGIATYSSVNVGRIRPNQKIPSYLRDGLESDTLQRGSLRVAGNHNILQSEQGSRTIGRRIYDTAQHVRPVGVDDLLEGDLGNNQFFERFLTDLNDIETINNRVERDIQHRVQQRITKFGKDGKRILGIHIAVPVEYEIEPFEKYGQANIERENKIKNDLYYTKKLIDGSHIESGQEPEDQEEENFDIKNTNVYMGQAEQQDPIQKQVSSRRETLERDATTFNLTNL